MAFKSTFRTRRHRSPQVHEQNENSKPFFSKTIEPTVQNREDTAFFQPKLTIGQPGDQYEQEADQMADAVVSQSNSPASIQQKAEGIQKMDSSRIEEDRKIQEKPLQMQSEASSSEAMMDDEEKAVQMQAVEEEKLQKQESETEEDLIQKQEEDEPEKAVQMQSEPTSEETVEEEEKPVQMKARGNAAKHAGAKLSRRIKSSSGRGHLMDKSTRTQMENSFGIGFSDVNIHTGPEALEMNKALGAQAFTHGKDIYFNTGKYRPDSIEGKHLLAHELTHVVQQGGGNEKIQKRPSAPSYKGTKGSYSESEIQLPKLKEVFLMDFWAYRFIYPEQTISVSISDPTINHLSWEFYDPSDNMLSGSFSTTTASSQATTLPFKIENKPDWLSSDLQQGRYLVRCVGRKDGMPIAYADTTFYLWKNKTVEKYNLKDLKNIIDNPTSHSLGDVGAAYARSMMLEHQEAIASTGTGKYVGSECTSKPEGVPTQNCTSYVLEVLKNAFEAKGKGATWQKVFSEAQKTSGGKFKGTDLIKALVSKAGWKSVFWSPDKKNPSDSDNEHPYAYKVSKNKGTYYDIPVEKDKAIIDYRLTGSEEAEKFSQLDKLKNVSLSVLAARGGKHLALILNGVVYEVHWDKGVDDADLIEATPLEDWDWLSGVLSMPSEDFKKHF